MSANVLAILGTIVIPLIVICVVCVVTFVNLYLNIRRRFPAKVNCWFCNVDTRVPYDQRNSFHCSSCRQYNGFTADGDYNREIPEQYQQQLNNYCYHQPSNITDDDKWGNSARSMAASSNGSPHNGLCFGCNRNQELKIHQLASFVAEDEANYDAEVDEYRKQLEQAYKLCGRCERVLKRTLNDVKRNILGAKLAQIGSKSLKVLDMHMRASTKHLAQVKRQQWAKVCVYVIAALLLMKLSQELTESGWTVADLILLCPSSLLTGLTVVLSYVLAIKQLVWTHLGKLLTEPAIQQTTERCETLGNEILQRYAPQLLQTPMQLFESLSASLPRERSSSFLLNGAILAMGALLTSLGSQQTAIKQMLIIILCSADCILKYTQYQDAIPVLVPLLITIAALVLALSCIGQRVVRSDVVGNDMNSSFHKIYSQQCSENDYSDVDTSANGDQSPASLKQHFAQKYSAAYPRQPSNISFMEPQHSPLDAGVDLTRKSLDTTKSGSPSPLSISPTSSFFVNSYAGNSSKLSGSLFSVAEAAHPELNNSGSVFGGGGSLLKTPSFSVGDFKAVPNHHQARWSHRKSAPSPSASGRYNQFRYSMNTIDQEADTLHEDVHNPLIEDDIDRLSISGRVSMNASPRPGNRACLGNGNPFSHMNMGKGGLDHSEISAATLRQRLNLRPRPEPFVPARDSHWAGMLGAASGAIVGGGQLAQMSRTSSQSSGFESQVETTRRNTPTEADVLSVYTAPDASQLEPSKGPPSPVPSSASVFHNRHSNSIHPSQARSLFGEPNIFNHALQQPGGPSGLFFPKFSPNSPTNGGAASSPSTVSGLNRHIFPPQQSQTPSYPHHHHHQQNHSFAGMGIGGGSSLSLHNHMSGTLFNTAAFPAKSLRPQRDAVPQPPSVAATSFYTSNQSTATGRASLLNINKQANELTNGTLPSA